MSNANETAVRIEGEQAFGVTQGSAWTELPYTGESLKQAMETKQSETIRSDRMTQKYLRTSLQAAGGINGELIPGAYDTPIAAALMASSWSTPDAAIPSVATAANGVLSKSNAFGSVAVGDWVRLSGSVAGPYKVTAKASDSNITVVGEAFANSLTVTVHPLSFMKNGSTLTTYSIWKAYTDVSENLLLTGCGFDSIELGVSAQEIATIGFNVVGKIASMPTAVSGSVTAPSALSPFNAVDHAPVVIENGELAEMTQLSLSLSNSLRARQIITGGGAKGARSLGKGGITMEGSTQAYFATKSQYQRYLDFQRTDFGYGLHNEDGKVLCVDLPAGVYTDGDILAEGRDGDVMARMSLGFERDVTTDSMIRIFRG